jgi:hypothetical protein
MTIEEMLDADRWARWVLTARPDESMNEAARRVLDALNAGIEQPRGAAEAAVVIDGPGDPWSRVIRAADIAKKNRGPRLVTTSAIPPEKP